MTISVVFDPPLPSDNPTDFNTKAFALLGDLNTWSTQANALPGEVATNLIALLAAPPAIGSTTPAAGSFTTLSASGRQVWFGGTDYGSYLSTHVDPTNAPYPAGLAGYTLTFNTGPNSARVARLTIDTAGAVTIPGSVTVGTLSASNGLTITKNGPTARALTIKNDSLNINEYVEIHFQNSGTDVIQSSIRSVRDTNGSFGTSLQFLTENDITSGEAVRMTLSGTGAVTIPGSLSLTGGTFGYGVGAGGTAIQATSKSTAVTLNKPSGQITMNNAALAAGAVVSFTLTNSFVGMGDGVIINIVETVASTNYQVWAGIGSGTVKVNLRNISAGSLSDSVVVNFQVVKGATT